MFSIIVPTFNRASSCASAVQSVLVQDTSVAYEIIVVDNNSTDETRERIGALCRQAPARARYVFEPRQGASTARNAGIAAARGDVIACIDDDVVVQPGWLSALADAYRTRPDAWCVGGRIVLALPDALPHWFDPQHGRLLTSHLGRFDLGDATIERRYPKDLYGGNFTVRREALDRVGFFDTALGPVAGRQIEAEETELCWRIQQAGGAVYYCGAAVVTHVIPAGRLTKSYFRRRAYWNGKTWSLMGRKEVRDVRPMGPVRAAGRVVRHAIRRLVFPRRFDPCKTFEDEVRFWFYAGYLHQALLTRLRGPRREAGPRLL